MNGQLAIYRSCTPVLDTQYEPGGERTLVETLVEALSAVEGVDAIELSPIYDFVDLEALTKLVDGHEGVADAETLIGFTVDRWNVFVTQAGRILICDGQERTAPEPIFTTPGVRGTGD